MVIRRWIFSFFWFCIMRMISQILLWHIFFLKNWYVCKRIGTVTSFLVIEIDSIIKALESFLHYRCSKGRTHNRHFYTSHKLSSKLPHRPHSHWFNENKQFIQNCNYFKTNYVICCAPHRRFPGNDVTWIRDYHISTVLFNDEGKKEVKNVESTKISESKDDKPQKDGAAKVVKPVEKSKEVGPPAKKKLSVRIMDELKHYYHGFKLLFKEFRMSTRYMIDVVIFRKSLKRREIKQVLVLLFTYIVS